MSILTFNVNENGVGTVVIDLPGERLNLLNRQALEEMEVILGRVEKSDEIRAIVIISGKEDNFLAGADINMFAEFKTAEDAYQGSRTGQKLLSRLFDLKKPVVCAVNGACMGGGLELALNCHYR